MEPALQSWDGHDNDQEKPVSEEKFLEEFKKVAERVTQNLKELPVIVAHSENTFDGSVIKRLLSNQFELDKVYTSVVSLSLVSGNVGFPKEGISLVLPLLINSFIFAIYAVTKYCFRKCAKRSQWENIEGVFTCGARCSGSIS